MLLAAVFLIPQPDILARIFGLPHEDAGDVPPSAECFLRLQSGIPFAVL